MTTIAYKNGIIAYDSRVCQGPTIVDDDANKMEERNGYKFFFSGVLSDAEKLIKLFFDKSTKKGVDCNLSAFVVGPEKELYQTSINPDGGEFWKILRRKDTVWAAGSGGDHALTAMDCGKSAKQSVEYAIKRDAGSGGTIREYKI